MLRIRNLKNKYQKRLIRPLYAQTQATPYAAVLDDTFRDASGDYVLPGAAFKYKSGLVPGTVMANRGDKVTVATGANTALVPFGLLANFVGGELDDLGDENFVGVWRGPDSVFEILAPGFDDTGLSVAWDASTPGLPVQLYAGVDGRLSTIASPGNRLVVAHLLERPNANRIVVDLKV
jgi:hypothetical protein